MGILSADVCAMAFGGYILWNFVQNSFNSCPHCGITQLVREKIAVLFQSK